jgi:beta-galactosidase
MYQRPDWCLDQIRHDSAKRPVILCEYAHAMGNSGGCLQHYWRLFQDEKYPRFQGGFIWDFVDQGLSLSKDEPNKFIYGGDFGESPHSKNFCCNGLTSPIRVPFPDAIEASYFQSPIQLHLVCDCQSSMSPNVILMVTNHRSFLSLSDLRVTVNVYYARKAYCDKELLGSFDVNVDHVASQQIHAMDIMPSLQDVFCSNSIQLVEHGVLWLDVTAVKKAGTSLWNANKDVTIYHTSFELSSLDNLLGASSINEQKLPSTSQHEQISVIENVDTLQLRWTDADISVTFDKWGALIGWKIGDEELLLSPIEVCLFRALTDNDRGGDSVSYSKRWIAAGYHTLRRMNSTSRKHEVHPNGDVRIQSFFKLAPNVDIQSGIEFYCEMNFLCRVQSGAIEITSSVHCPAGIPDLPRVGLRFSLPSAFDQVRWMGLGPHEAYDDRKSSSYFGIFEATIKELHTPYVFPQENGRRADPR